MRALHEHNEIYRIVQAAHANCPRPHRLHLARSRVERMVDLPLFDCRQTPPCTR